MNGNNYIFTYLNSVLVKLVLIIGVFAIVYSLTKIGLAIGFALSIAPLLIIVLFYVFSNPNWGLLLVFTINYFIMGINRYVPSMPGGVVMDGVIGITFIATLIHVFQGKSNFSRAYNGLTLVASIWLAYCVFEIFNPQVTSTTAWATTIRSVSIYFFLLAILTPILVKDIKDLKRLLFLWSIFTLLAFLKAIMQKTVGFDFAETRWLYVDGGKDTHLLQSGIRYFSFFTDAGNFGSGMGYSLVVFTLVAVFIKDFKLKAYYFIVALCAGYAMMISGTRGAMAVPFAGFFLFVFLSKNVKAMVFFTIFLVFAFVFFKYTMIGHGNAQIRRMRTAFDPNDASLQLRLSNQKKMRLYLADKPFGIGIGLGGVKAKRYAPYAYMSQIATDSWFVMIWVETGIVGLVLHIGILLYILIYGAYLALFVLKDKELKGLITALLAGIFGIYATSYGNEVLGQFPTGFILYISMAVVFVSPYFDKQIEEENLKGDTNDR